MSKLWCSPFFLLVILSGMSTFLNGQTFALGLTGAGGMVSKTKPVTANGIFAPRLTQPLIAQGGIYLQVDLADVFFIRLSGQFTAVQYGVNVEFDPSLQPEVPFKVNSENRFWLNGLQPELRIGYSFPLNSQRKLFLMAGFGRRFNYSTANVYSFVMGLPSGQGLLCYEETFDSNESRVPVLSFGLEYPITLGVNYTIFIGLEYQYARSSSSQVNYEFFPARSVSYSSGNYGISPHHASLRLSLPVLWWKKKTD
ncbi:MAG: hypothetical protein IM638_16370 [Bacteroidetes bacterium]|nr:hypothetical protein [Bacteroidota bacterium]